MTEFFREVRSADAEDAPRYILERRKAIRFYCVQHGSRWLLQIRAPFKTRNGKPSQKFIISSANLDHADIVALRKAIDMQLLDKKASEPTP